MCGIIGIYLNESEKGNAAKMATLGLFAEQHRGQESCGIAVSDGKQIDLVKEMGLVKDVFTENKIKQLGGKLALGHVRYPTKGKSVIENAQPFLATSNNSTFALASNGDIVNYTEIRKKLEDEGLNFQSENDGELILKLLNFYHAKKDLSIIKSIKKIMREIRGTFSAILLTKNEMYIFRDAFGNRPFVFGKIDKHSFVFASETCSLDILNAEFIREIRPAEIVYVSENEFQSISQNPDEFRDSSNNAHCVFEMIYFSRPDSIIFNHKVYEFRKKLGEKLAENETKIPDVVTPVPDSSNFIALGYANKLNVEFNLGLIRNHYVGRTFISPEQTIRDEGVLQKFNTLPGYFKGKIITLVDDSIVRGTTLRKLVAMIRRKGAKEIHVRIGSPMVKFSCFYGIDTPTRKELIANQKSLEHIRKFLDADSLRYLSINELKNCVKSAKEFCYACFDGKYPIDSIPQRHEDTMKANNVIKNNKLSREGDYNANRFI